MDNEAKISRKDFIKKSAKATGATLAGAAAAGTAYSYFGNSNYKKEFPELPENKTSLAKNGKSVLILGAGLGGLMAACELVDRGFQVTLLEKSDVPGGKLKAWRDTHFGRRYFGDGGYEREHGLHAIWGFYKNLREFLGRHQIPLNHLDDDDSFYYFISSRGVRNKIVMSQWPVPFARLQMAGRGVYVPSAEDINKPAPGLLNLARAGMKMWGFDYLDDEQRLYLDRMTFWEWARKVGVNEENIRHYFDGLSEMTYFMTTRESSALAIINQMRLGVVPHDSMVDFFKWPPDKTFIGPMVQHILKNGGRIEYLTEVTGMEIEGGRVKGVNVNQKLPPGRAVRCRVCGNIITGGSHEHCPFCGAHKEMFQTLNDAQKKVRSFKADYYITAMDLEGAQKFVTMNKLFVHDPYFERIMNLSRATIMCINLLYENSNAWEKRFPPGSHWSAVDFMPTGYKFLGFTTNWSIKQIPQLREKKVDLIEVQSSNYRAFMDKKKTKDFKTIARMVHDELKLILPDLPPPSEHYINIWTNYTGFRPGDEKNRPAIQSPLDNLLFIGDWVYAPHHSIFMERTNVTAKMVTNQILEKAGMSEGRLTIMKSGIPDWLVEMAGLFTSVKV